MIFRGKFWLLIIFYGAMVSANTFQLPGLCFQPSFFVSIREYRGYSMLSESGFYRLDSSSKTMGPLINLTFKKGALFINGRLSKEKIISLASFENNYVCNNQSYTGTILIVRAKTGWYISHCPAGNGILGLASLTSFKASGVISCASLMVADHAYQVKVLLDEQEKVNAADVWSLSCRQGFIVVDPHANTKQIIKKDQLSISFFNKHFIVDKQYTSTDSQLIIFPITGHLQVKEREYQGGFLITLHDQKLYLINILDIEDYVFSVLKTESWPGWPLEVNKVFAIASRTYVIGVILDNKNKKLPYHVKNTNKHQTYTGVHQNAVLKEAVEQTRGVFLAYNKKPIIAMFDICCGGVIPAHIYGVNFNHAPYLARSYACTYCKNSKVFNWRAEYHVHDLEQYLKKELTHLRKLKEVKVVKKDKAGLVQTVHAKASRNYTLSGKKLYGLLDKVKSFCFTAKRDNNKIVFKGKGYGHHLGLCQWGAREMVRLGYDYQSVLAFYYPNTHFMRLA